MDLEIRRRPRVVWRDIRGWRFGWEILGRVETATQATGSRMITSPKGAGSADGTHRRKNRYDTFYSFDTPLQSENSDYFLQARLWRIEVQAELLLMVLAQECRAADASS